jgi:predicted transcriptional regulator
MAARLSNGLVRAIITVMKPAKAMTIRLTSDQAEELETVAAVDQQPISEVIRAAIAEHIAARKQDVEFQDSLRDRIERAQRMLRATAD